MKRLVLLVIALSALAVAVPVAETAPTSDTGCTVEHLQNTECQGPDADPAANACQINTWVDNARCELTVEDGVASGYTASTTAYAALQDPNWHAEFHYVIRDKSTGQVLFSRDGSNTTPVSGSTDIPSATFFSVDLLPQQGGAEVVCEVTGTHTPAGAAMSALAATQGSGEYNNEFFCRVN